jgi:hypothetical protein
MNNFVFSGPTVRPGGERRRPGKTFLKIVKKTLDCIPAL